MISQFERYGFLGEVKVYTYRNLFKNHVPLGFDLFKQMEKLFQDDERLTMVRGQRNLRLHEFMITNSKYAELLFQMRDPGIPDNVLADRKSGGLRVARRKASEDPAVSAHMVVHLDEQFDLGRAYPACIEIIDYLPRSLIIQFFNQWMAERMAEKQKRPGEKEAKVFQPRFEFVAPVSQTIKDALESGGILRGVKWVEDKLVEGTFGDDAYPVERRTDVALTVKNRPTGETAKKFSRNCGKKRKDKVQRR